jgi:hypothetical protein
MVRALSLCGTETVTSLTKWLHQPPKAYMGYRIKMKSFHNVLKKKSEKLPVSHKIFV